MFNDTTRTLPRRMEDAFPNEYMNRNIIEGPFYSAPHISDYSVLFGIIVTFSLCGIIMWNYL